jgi:hypothetical protein
MTITRHQLGQMYVEKGGALERRFIGCVLSLSLAIRQGWYDSPSEAQTAWANHTHGCDQSEKARIARQAMEWGLCNNPNLQSQGDSLADGDLDWITAEYSKTWTDQ